MKRLSELFVGVALLARSLLLFYVRLFIYSFIIIFNYESFICSFYACYFVFLSFFFSSKWREKRSWLRFLRCRTRLGKQEGLTFANTDLAVAMPVINARTNSHTHMQIYITSQECLILTPIYHSKQKNAHTFERCAPTFEC